VGGYLDIIQHRQVIEQPDVLKGPGNAASAYGIGRKPLDVFITEADTAFVGFIYAGDEIKDGGLAGPVGADQADQFAFFHVKDEVQHCAQAAKRFVEIIYFQKDSFSSTPNLAKCLSAQFFIAHQSLRPEDHHNDQNKGVENHSDGWE
jgi:hypothetical protein